MRNATSSGPSSMPMEAASSGPRPQSSVARSPPITDMFATSDEVGKPSGSVRNVPLRPLLAILSIHGVDAASSGVLPPSSAIGSSAMPSPRKSTVLKGFIFFSYLSNHDFVRSVIFGNSSCGITTGCHLIAGGASGGTNWMDFSIAVVTATERSPSSAVMPRMR